MCHWWSEKTQSNKEPGQVLFNIVSSRVESRQVFFTELGRTTYETCFFEDIITMANMVRISAPVGRNVREPFPNPSPLLSSLCNCFCYVFKKRCEVIQDPLGHSDQSILTQAWSLNSAVLPIGDRVTPAKLSGLRKVGRECEAMRWFLAKVVSPGKQVEHKTTSPGHGKIRFLPAIPRDILKLAAKSLD